MSLQCLLSGCLILIMPTLSKKLVLPPIPLNLIFGSLYLCAGCMSLRRFVCAIDTDPHESSFAFATLIEYLSLSIMRFAKALLTYGLLAWLNCWIGYFHAIVAGCYPRCRYIYVHYRQRVMRPMSFVVVLIVLILIVAVVRCLMSGVAFRFFVIHLVFVLIFVFLVLIFCVPYVMFLFLIVRFLIVTRLLFPPVIILICIIGCCFVNWLLWYHG